MSLKLTVLGCGSSSGTPVIGCDCSICQSPHPKNQRSRCSAWISYQNTHIIIDTGTDFRQQALRENIPRVDTVLYTHPHADHLNGIDDLRAFCFLQKSPIDIYGSRHTIDNITQRFDYAFLEPNQHWNRPVLIAHTLQTNPTHIKEIPIYSYPLPHGRWQSTAYRIGNIAWLTDISDIDHHTIQALQNLDYLFIDCLMTRPYPSHLSLEQAIEFSRKINPKHTYLIHMIHSLDYHQLKKDCPNNIEPAYDGLTIHSPFQAAPNP